MNLRIKTTLSPAAPFLLALFLVSAPGLVRANQSLSYEATPKLPEEVANDGLQNEPLAVDASIETMTHFLNEKSGVLSDPSPANEPDFDSQANRSCSQSGSATHGEKKCTEFLENGARIDIVSQYALAGDEFKRQTVKASYDATGKLIEKESVRLKTLYQYDATNHRYKEADYIDILQKPENGRATRALIIRQYDPETEKIKKITWTHYRQEETPTEAKLSHHAVLVYDKNGKPVRGKAEKWDNGEVSDILLNWDKNRNKNLRIELSGWHQWENWIRSLAARAQPI